MWKVLSPEVGQFRLARMIQGFFLNATIKLPHAVLSWLLEVWPSTFSGSLVFQRMNNSSLAEQKLAPWFWPWSFFPTTAQAAMSEAYRFWPPVRSTTWAWTSLPEYGSHTHDVGLRHSHPCCEPLWLTQTRQCLWVGVCVHVCTHTHTKAADHREPGNPNLNRGWGSWLEFFARDLLSTRV